MKNESDTRNHRASVRKVRVGNFSIGGGEALVLCAGPCVVEETGTCAEIAAEAKRVCSEHGVNYIFKASYDKANKTIPGSYRGPGWKKGLEVLKEVKSRAGVPILSDVHEREQCAAAAEVCDILQIPALLSKQIDLILAAAHTGRPVNIKKGQFTAPWEMRNVVTRLTEEGYRDILVTERGTLFGYQQLVTDIRSLVVLDELSCPVLFDASHSVCGNEALAHSIHRDNRYFIAPLCRAAVGCGVDGIFLEVHPQPEKALSDSAGTFPLGELGSLVHQLVEIDRAFAQSARTGKTQ